LSLFLFLKYNDYGLLTLNVKYNNEGCEYELDDFFKYSKGGKNEKNLFTLYDYINSYLDTFTEEAKKSSMTYLVSRIRKKSIKAICTKKL